MIPSVPVFVNEDMDIKCTYCFNVADRGFYCNLCFDSTDIVTVVYFCKDCKSSIHGDIEHQPLDVI